MRAWIIMLCLLLTGCAATDTVQKYPLESAAIADTASTLWALDQGYAEANPLGFPATIVLKALIIAAKPQLKACDQDQLNRWGTGLWTGAAVNNSLLVLTANTLLSPIAGLVTATVIIMNWHKSCPA